MSSRFQRQSRVQGIAGLFVLVGVILAAFFTESHSSALGDAARIFLFPGAIADTVLSGNAHAGFGGWLDYVVTVFGTWLFWMLPVCLTVWFFTRKSEVGK